MPDDTTVPLWDEDLRTAVLNLRVIVGALMAGCLVFLGIAVFAVESPVDADRPAVLTWVGLAVAAWAVVARLVVPRFIVAAARKRIVREAPPAQGGAVQDAGREADRDRARLVQDLAAVYRTKTIASAAVFEGATFMLTVSYLIERSPVSLGSALALIVVLAAHLPTRSGVVRWMERQLRLVEEERQLGWRE